MTPERPLEGAADLRIHRYTTPALDGAHAFGFRDGWNAAMQSIAVDLDDAPKLREALRSVGDIYEVDGRHEWHDRDCIYRKTWPMGGEDEPWCIKVRALLASKP